MALRVTTRSSTRALVSLASVKTRLGITGSSEDATLTAMIEEASSAIEAFVGLDFPRQRYELTDRGSGSREFWLPRFPVDPDSITLEVDGVAVTDFEVREAATGLFWRDGGFPRSEDADVFAFKAGYVLPDQVETSYSSLTSRS